MEIGLIQWLFPNLCTEVDSMWWVCGLVSIGLVATAPAQTREVRVGYALQDGNGQVRQFANQYGLTEGAFLEMFALELKGIRGGDLKMSASGFGAEPRDHFRLNWRRPGDWKFELAYNRRSKQVATQAYSDDRGSSWSLTQWKGAWVYDGFHHLRLRLEGGQTERAGRLSRPFYGLGIPYVVDRELKERTEVYGVSLETRSLPLKLILEQRWNRWRREYRSEPGNNGMALQPDRDLLVAVNTPGKDENQSPSSRLTLLYHKPQYSIQMMGFALRDRLDSGRDDTTLYQLADEAGRVEINDELMGQSDRDTAMAALNLGFMVRPWLSFRLTGRYRDQGTDTGLGGVHRIALEGRDTTVVLEDAVEERGFLDLRETDLAAEAYGRFKNLTVALSFHDLEKELDWQRASDGTRFVGQRQTDAWKVHGVYRPGAGLQVRLGLESGSYGHPIFRVDPRSVDRVWVRVRFKPESSPWQFSFQGNNQEADNSRGTANPKRDLEQWGFTVSFNKKEKLHGSLSGQWLKLDTAIETEFYAPDLQTGVALFQSDLLLLSGRLVWSPSQRHRLIMAASLAEDRGRSAPLDDHQADLRFEVTGTGNLLYAFFAQYWDQDFHNGLIHYEVTHFGTSLGWKF